MTNTSVWINLVEGEVQEVEVGQVGQLERELREPVGRQLALSGDRGCHVARVHCVQLMAIVDNSKRMVFGLHLTDRDNGS